MKCMGLLFILTLLAKPVAAQELIEGTALALDGDTILVTQADGGEVTIRLWGVDAPDMEDWPWGPRARKTLDEILRHYDARVTCSPKGENHQPVVARCVAGEAENNEGEWAEYPRVFPASREIGEFVIGRGVAVEHRNTSKGFYSLVERGAFLNGRGIWQNWNPN